MELLILLVGVGVWLTPASLCSLEPRPVPTFGPAPGKEDCDPPTPDEVVNSAFAAAAFLSWCFFLKRNAMVGTV